MKKDKIIQIVIGLLSIIVLLVVVILNRKIINPPEHIPSFVYSLPLLNAILNSTSLILLVISLWAIKKKRVQWHKSLNLTAFVLSALFLISYVVAHFYLPETLFGDANHNNILESQELENVRNVRPIYLFILISHIILAAITFPLVLLSFYYGLENKIIQHRKIVKWSYPLWLYVCFTGPIIYWLLKPYYAF